MLFFGISTYISGINYTKEIIKTIKSMGDIPVVAGGFGPSFFPEEFLSMGVDIVSYCEGERTILDISSFFQKKLPIESVKGIIYKNFEKKTIVNYPMPLIEDLDALPFPSRDTMKYVIERKSSVNISSTRGCKGRCQFCSVISFYKLSFGNQWRERSIKNFVDEIECLYQLGVDFFKIVDDSFIESSRGEKWCLCFKNEIQKRGLKARFRGSLCAENVTDNIIKHLIDSGFFSFAIGIENFAQTALSRFGKRANVNDNLQALNTLKKYNVYVQCGLILFDPDTTLEELKINLKYFKEYDWILCKGIFSELYAAQGTEFTQKMIQNNKKDLVRCHENYKYAILDIKANIAYHCLKKWHKSYNGLYDMLVDPLTAPKNVPLEIMAEIYNLYLIVRKIDVAFMEKLINAVESGDNAYGLTDSSIESNEMLILDVYNKLVQIYLRCGLEYDGLNNNYLTL